MPMRISAVAARIRIGFFVGRRREDARRNCADGMDDAIRSKAREIARAAVAFEQQRTGHSPKSVAVALCGDTVVITLHGALSAAETAIARTPDGISRLQEFHRYLFENASDSLRQEIRRITGAEIRESAMEIESGTGAVVKVFTTGTMVQVFILGSDVGVGAWCDEAPYAKSQC